MTPFFFLENYLNAFFCIAFHENNIWKSFSGSALKISNFGQFWQGWRCYQKTATIISHNYLYSFQGEFMIINKMRWIELEIAFVWGDARKYFAPNLKNYRKSLTMLVRKRFSHDLWAKSYHNITFLLPCLWTIAFPALLIDMFYVKQQPKILQFHKTVGVYCMPITSHVIVS